MYVVFVCAFIGVWRRWDEARWDGIRVEGRIEK